MRNIVEDFDPSINVEGGSIDINDEAVVDAINRNISAVTSSATVTPYIALEKIRKVLAYYKIFIPHTVFLEGDEGNEVFEISQFGEKSGVTNDGEFKTKNDDGLYLYFEWMTNDDGIIDTFSEIVDEEDLEELLADFDDEGEEEENDDSDGAEPSHDMYKAANMREETINEVSKEKLKKYLKGAKTDRDLAISDREHYKKNLKDPDRAWTKSIPHKDSQYKMAVDRNARAMKRAKGIAMAKKRLAKKK